MREDPSTTRRDNIVEELRKCRHGEGLTVLQLQDAAPITCSLAVVRDELERGGWGEDVAAAAFEVIRHTISTMRPGLRTVLGGEFNLRDDLYGPTLAERQPRIEKKLANMGLWGVRGDNYKKQVNTALHQLVLELLSASVSPLRQNREQFGELVRRMADQLRRMDKHNDALLANLRESKQNLSILIDTLRELESVHRDGRLT